MKDGLFHRDIGLPDCESIHREFRLAYSEHAQTACAFDRYGVIRPPATVIPHQDNLIEVEVRRGRIVKAVIRISYNETFDLSIVFIPGDAFVKTCWLNRKTDTHRTLDRSKYQTYVVL
jgi:hypothetical protein